MLIRDSIFKMFFMGKERYLPHNSERFVLRTLREDGGKTVDLHKTCVYETHTDTHFIVLPILWKGIFHNENIRREGERERTAHAPILSLFETFHFRKTKI